MAKKSSVEKNKNRAKLVKRLAGKRDRLKAVIMSKETSPEERFNAQIKLAEVPRNSAKVRLRNRCEISGRPRGYYRKFKMSRIAIRDYAAMGEIPGMIKASW